MSGFLRALKIEVCRGVFSLRFLAALPLPLLFYLISGGDELLQLWDSPHVDVLHFAVFLSDVGRFSMMLILAACFPSAASYCDDLSHQYLRCQLLRCGKRNYCAAKIATGAITGGLVTAGGLVLFLLVLWMHFPLVIPGSGLYDSAVMAKSTQYFGELLAEGDHLGFFGVMVLACGLFGAVWGAVGIAISGLMPNPFVAMFAPFLLEKLLLMLPVPSILVPRTILHGGFNLGGWRPSVLFSLGITVILIALCWLIFSTCVERRMRHG